MVNNPLELSDKDKLLVHTAWIMAVVADKVQTLDRARIVINVLRKNKRLKVTAEEQAEIFELVRQEIESATPLLKLYNSGDLPPEPDDTKFNPL